jgi:DNA-binding NtrC family response regulator
MNYLLGLTSTKDSSEKEFQNDLLSSVSNKTDTITKGHTFATLLSYIAVERYDAIFVDWKILDSNFEEFNKRLNRINNKIPLVIYTDDRQISGELFTVCEPLFAVIPKNATLTKTPETIKRIKKYYSIVKDADDYAKSILRPNGFNNFIGNSELTQLVYQQLIRVSQTEFTTLILGGSGSGKELSAKTIHYLSTRQNNAFISLNCAAIPATLQESELFGYEKGAFTGADKAKEGKFELADKGTLFLDEVGDMPIDLQAKLLRVLEDSTFSRVGGVKEQTVDARFIAATNRDLSQMVGSGDFRSDLFYRLNVIPIELPRLNKRGDDIILLILNFIAKMTTGNKLRIKAINWDLIDKLKSMELRGNVRELENLLTRIIFHTTGSVISSKVLDNINIQDSIHDTDSDESSKTRLLPLWEVEKEMIERALDIYPNNLSKIANKLEISRSSLYRKLKKYELED